MKFSVERLPGAGVAVGGHIINEELAFRADFAVAGIRLQMGREICYLSRDEAHEVAFAILAAAHDA